MKALDLFCGGGGASMGLHQAGFEVTGVDDIWQPCYPFHQLWMDALKVPLQGYDFIWASPPCQAHSSLRRFPWVRDKEYLDLIPATRNKLEAYGIPFVIENVVGAPLRPDLLLCGTMVGLQTADGSAELWRHRQFELGGFTVPQPSECNHGRRPAVIGVYGKKGHNRRGQRPGKWAIHAEREADRHFTHEQCQEAMGINWMTPEPLSQAIPPAFSRYIAEQFLRRKEARTSVAQAFRNDLQRSLVNRTTDVRNRNGAGPDDDGTFLIFEAEQDPDLWGSPVICMPRPRNTKTPRIHSRSTSLPGKTGFSAKGTNQAGDFGLRLKSNQRRRCK